MKLLKLVTVIAALVMTNLASAQVSGTELNENESQAYVAEMVKGLKSKKSNLNAHLLAGVLKDLKSNLQVQALAPRVIKSEAGSIHFIELSFRPSKGQGVIVEAQVMIQDRTVPASVEVFDFKVEREVMMTPYPGVGMGTRGSL